MTEVAYSARVSSCEGPFGNKSVSGEKASRFEPPFSSESVFQGPPSECPFSTPRSGTGLRIFPFAALSSQGGCTKNIFLNCLFEAPRKCGLLSHPFRMVFIVG